MVRLQRFLIGFALNRNWLLKKNQPSPVILSSDEYTRLAETEENYILLLEATKRLTANEGKSAIPAEDIMNYFGITEAE